MRASHALDARRAGLGLVLFAGAAIGLLALVATLLLGAGSSTLGPVTFIIPIVGALAPVGIIVAFRYPMIVPFALWAMLLPFDFLLGSSSAGTVTRYLELLAIVMISLRIVVTRRMVAPAAAWYPWLILVGWMLLTVLWTIGPAKTQIALAAIVPLFLLMTVVAIYPISVVEMRAVVIGIVSGSLIASGFAFQLYARGKFSGDGRLTLQTDNGLSVDENMFAAGFLLPIAICLSVVIAHRSIRMRILAGLAIVLMVSSIFLSGSRSGFIGLLVVFGYFVIKSRNRVALLGIAAGAGMAFLAFPSVLNRLTTSDKGSAYGSGRTFIWDVGRRALGDNYHWLTGAGIGAFPVAYDKALGSVYQPIFEGWSRASHNVLVGISVELGVFGISLLLYAWFRTFRVLSVIDKTSGNFPLRTAAEATLIAMFVVALFIDPMLLKMYWLIFIFPFLLHNLERPIAASKANSFARQFELSGRRVFARARPRFEFPTRR